MYDDSDDDDDDDVNDDDGNDDDEEDGGVGVGGRLQAVSYFFLIVRREYSKKIRTCGGWGKAGRVVQERKKLPHLAPSFRASLVFAPLLTDYKKK